MGMSFISMISMEVTMNLTDYLLTGGAILTWWVVPLMLIVGFLKKGTSIMPLDEFPSIRQYGGLSGFLKRSESEYDVPPSTVSFATNAGNPLARPFIIAGTESCASADPAEVMQKPTKGSTK